MLTAVVHTTLLQMLQLLMNVDAYKNSAATLVCIPLLVRMAPRHVCSQLLCMPIGSCGWGLHEQPACYVGVSIDRRSVFVEVHMLKWMHNATLPS